MTIAHTPGPWDHNIGPRYPIYTRKGHHKVAAAMFGGATGVSEAEAMANMRLIAAAPDLLAAACRALDIIHSMPWDASNSVVTKAQDALVDAIARATT